MSLFFGVVSIRSQLRTWGLLPSGTPACCFYGISKRVFRNNVADVANSDAINGESRDELNSAKTDAANPKSKMRYRVGAIIGSNATKNLDEIGQAGVLSGRPNQWRQSRRGTCRRGASFR